MGVQIDPHRELRGLEAQKVENRQKSLLQNFLTFIRFFITKALLVTIFKELFIAKRGVHIFWDGFLEIFELLKIVFLVHF